MFSHISLLSFFFPSPNQDVSSKTVQADFSESPSNNQLFHVMTSTCSTEQATFSSKTPDTQATYTRGGHHMRAKPAPQCRLGPSLPMLSAKSPTSISGPSVLPQHHTHELPEQLSLQARCPRSRSGGFRSLLIAAQTHEAGFCGRISFR